MRWRSLFVLWSVEFPLLATMYGGAAAVLVMAIAIVAKLNLLPADSLLPHPGVHSADSPLVCCLPISPLTFAWSDNHPFVRFCFFLSLPSCRCSGPAWAMSFCVSLVRHGARCVYVARMLHLYTICGFDLSDLGRDNAGARAEPQWQQ